MSEKVALLAAGGTAGHLFPAQALAVELAARGWTVDLATDERADRYGFEFPARAVHIVPSETIRSRNVLALLRTGIQLGRGFFTARGVVGRIRPRIAVGFGGYPSIPPIFAARSRRVPTLLHEANAVMGRANRGLAKYVTAVATSWPQTRYVQGEIAAKATLTGIPVRPKVREAAATPYFAPAERLKLLVFGGSQGARVFADLVPPAFEAMDPALRARIDLVQQVREEDMARVNEAYGRLGLKAELAPFFTDLPARMAAAHLVVSRSGASTVAELAVIGRPAILVPLPHALDSDQLRNAEALQAAGGGIVAEQAGLSAEKLASVIAGALGDSERLVAMAEKAKSVGVPDATERLADLVEKVAR